MTKRSKYEQIVKSQALRDRLHNKANRLCATTNFSIDNLGGSLMNNGGLRLTDPNTIAKYFDIHPKAMPGLYAFLQSIMEAPTDDN